jgi:multiple sugar transport system substrate-binding protein
MTWSNFLGQYQILMKDSLGMMRLPTGGSQVGDYVKVSMMFSISAKSDHPDDAATFIDYFIHNADAVKVLGLERGVPASASVRDALKPSLKPYDAGQVEFFDKFSGKTRAAQSIPLSKKSVSAAAEKFMEESEKAVTS